MSDDFGIGDAGPGAGGGGGLYGFTQSDQGLRAIDIERPEPHENPADRAAQRLPKVAGAIVLILFLAWVVRVIWPG